MECPQATHQQLFTMGQLASASQNNMTDFNIYSLAFTSYSSSWSYGSLQVASKSALLLQSTQHA